MLAELAEVEDRVFRRAVVQFRLAAAGRLRGCIAEALAAADARDEEILNSGYEAHMAARGLTIYGEPVVNSEMGIASQPK